MILKNFLLVISFLTISTIALIYGVSPQWFFQNFLVDSQSPTVDQSHILRAVMMLYISLGLFWFYAAFSNKFRDAGIVVLAVFCGGLVSGRILSVIIDGLPSLIPVCVWLLRRQD